MREVITAVFLLIGSIFMFLAALGIFRMPDLFSRMQTATKAATLGAGAMLAAVGVHFGDTPTVSRVILIVGFVFLTAPVAAHVIARAAYSTGVKLWGGTVVDELAESKRESK